MAQVVRLAIARGIRVVPIPGPSAVLAALAARARWAAVFASSASPFPATGRGEGEAVARVRERRKPVVLFRIRRTGRQGTLRDLAAADPRSAAPAWRASSRSSTRNRAPRNVRLARGARPRMDRRDRDRPRRAHVPEAREAAIDDAAIDARIDAELARGLHAKTVAERLAAWSGRPRRGIYERHRAQATRRLNRERAARDRALRSLRSGSRAPLLPA